MAVQIRQGPLAVAALQNFPCLDHCSLCVEPHWCRPQLEIVPSERRDDQAGVESAVHCVPNLLHLPYLRRHHGDFCCHVSAVDLLWRCIWCRWVFYQEHQAVDHALQLLRQEGATPSWHPPCHRCPRHDASPDAWSPRGTASSGWRDLHERLCCQSHQWNRCDRQFCYLIIINQLQEAHHRGTRESLFHD